MSIKEKLAEILASDSETKQEEILKAIGEDFRPKDDFRAEKEKYNTLLAEKESLSAKVEEFENKQLTAEELANKKTEGLQKEIESMKLASNRSVAEKEFIKAGIEEETYSGLLDTLVTQDLDTSLKSVNSIVGTITANKEAVAAKIKQDLLDNTQTPPPSDPNGGTDGNLSKSTDGVTYL